MFWQLDMATSNISTMLERDDITLTEILEEDDILQELRSDNIPLIKFLRKDENLGTLVKMIVSEPEEDLDMTKKFKNASLAFELLTAEIHPSDTLSDCLIDPSIKLGVKSGFISENNDSNNDDEKSDKDEDSNKSLENEKLENVLDKPIEHIELLFSFLNSEEINPLLASYFSRTVAELLSRQPDKIWAYIRDHQGVNFLQNVIKHINTSAIWNLLMRLMTCKEINLKSDIVKWLSANNLIKALVDNLTPESGLLRNQAASLALSDIVNLSRGETGHFSINGKSNPLMEELEKGSTIEQIINIIVDANEKALNSPELSEECDSTILSSINVLLSFLEDKSNVPVNGMLPGYGMNGNDQVWSVSSLYPPDNNNSDDNIEMAEHNKQVILATLKALKPRIKDFVKILKREPVKQFERPQSSMPAGYKVSTLGSTRLNVVRLFVEIIKHDNEDMNNAFVENDVLKILLDLFFEFVFNNFLHTLVSDCVCDIIEPKQTSESSKDSSLNESLDKIEPQKENILLKNLLLECQLTQRILEAFKYDKAINLKTTFKNIRLPCHPDNEKLNKQSMEQSVASSLSSDNENNQNRNNDDCSISVHSFHDDEVEKRKEKAVKMRLKPPRLPYMGHLTKIANKLVLNCKDTETSTISKLNNYEQEAANKTNLPPLESCLMDFYPQSQKNINNIINKKEDKLDKKRSINLKEILSDKYEAVYNAWVIFIDEALMPLNKINNKKIGGLADDKFSNIMAPINTGNNLFSNNFTYDPNRTNEEDEDEEDAYGSNLTQAAKDCFTEYSNSSLIKAPDFPETTENKIKLIEEETNKHNKLESYDKVGQFKLDYNDHTEEELQMLEKQKSDREAFEKSLAHRIPAIDENYKDSKEEENRQLEKFKNMDYDNEEVLGTGDWEEEAENDDYDENEMGYSGNMNEDSRSILKNVRNFNEPNTHHNNSDEEDSNSKISNKFVSSLVSNYIPETTNDNSDDEKDEPPNPSNFDPWNIPDENEEILVNTPSSVQSMSLLSKDEFFPLTKKTSFNNISENEAVESENLTKKDLENSFEADFSSFSTATPPNKSGFNTSNLNPFENMSSGDPISPIDNDKTEKKEEAWADFSNFDNKTEEL